MASEPRGSGARRSSGALVPEQLIRNAADGSQRAFDALFHAHQPGLLRYLGTISPGLASEIASATWESVATSLHRFKGDGADFRKWLMTIARRRLVDEVRRSSRRPLAVAEVPEAADPTEADETWTGPDWAVEVLRRIPSRQAEVVALRVIGGLSVAEVAGLLGITEGNVRVLSHRGLQAIAAVLEDTEVDAGEIPSAV